MSYDKVKHHDGHRKMAKYWEVVSSNPDSDTQQLVEQVRRNVDGEGEPDFMYYVAYTNAMNDVAVVRPDIFDERTGKGLVLKMQLGYACHQRLHKPFD